MRKIIYVAGISSLFNRANHNLVIHHEYFLVHVEYVCRSVYLELIALTYCMHWTCIAYIMSKYLYLELVRLGSAYFTDNY